MEEQKPQDQKVYYDSPGHVAEQSSSVHPPVSTIPTPSIPSASTQSPVAPASITQEAAVSQANKLSTKRKIPSLPKKKLIILASVLGVIVLLLLVLGIVVSVLRGGSGVVGILPTETSSPTPTPIIEVKPLSPYVDDLEVIRLQEDLDTFEGDLNNTKLREDTLRIPVLEWDVSFK